MARRRGPGRIIGVAIGTIAILVIGLYGPATLAGPLPDARITATAPNADPATAPRPELPKDGASAVATGGAHPRVIAHAGGTDAVPIAGVAKLVTALVVLQKKPLAAGAHGPELTMTKADARDFARHVSQGDLGILVQPGERWSELQMLQAMLLGSSNNHADSLARWAFGSIRAYTDAAAAWLRAHGLTHTTVVDASGLSADDVGTADDAARLAALTMADPALAHLFAHPVDSLVDGRPLDDLPVFAPKLGVRGLSRSFTDQAGVCFVFALDTTVDGTTTTSYGAMLRQPDYPSLTRALTGLSHSARSSIRRHAIVARGGVFARIDTPWGAHATAVADGAISRVGWSAPHVDYRVDVPPLTTANAGSRVGHVRVVGDGIDRTVELRLSRTVSDPGVLWRLEHPMLMTRALLAAVRG